MNTSLHKAPKNAPIKGAANARGAGAKCQKDQDSAALAELRPGQSVELLKALHILTREGRLNQDSRRKLKQVEHLVQFIEKQLAELTPHAAE